MSISSKEKNEIRAQIKSAVIENVSETMSTSVVYLVGNKALDQAALNAKFKEWEHTSDVSDNFWQWIQTKHPELQQQQNVTYLNSAFEEVEQTQVFSQKRQENELDHTQIARFFTELKDNPLFNWLSKDSLHALVEYGEGIHPDAQAQALTTLPKEDVLSEQHKIKESLSKQKEEPNDQQDEHTNDETPKL